MNMCPRCLQHTESPRCPGDNVATLALESTEPPCGTVIADRFLLLGVLGRGGMGIVYRAWQISTDRAVALKLLAPSIARDPDLVTRFLRESRVTAGLRSPHTVTVLDAGKLPDGTLYLAMELIGGRSLARVLSEDGRLSPRRALDLAAQMCLSLEEAHARGLVHRDLKPANVMVEWIGEGREFAKVLDFGVAKVLDAEGTELTGRGSGPGTPAYMSPEQLSGGNVGPAADLYALGVVLFEMLTGRRPFEADSALAVMLRHLNDPPPRLADVAPDLRDSKALDGLVRRCLAKEARARHPSAAALRADLDAVARGEPLTTGGVRRVDGAPVGTVPPARVDSGPMLPAAGDAGVAETLDSAPALPQGAVAARAVAPAKKALLELKAWGCSIQLALALGLVAVILVPAVWRRAERAPASRAAPVAEVDDAEKLRGLEGFGRTRGGPVDEAPAPSAMAPPAEAAEATSRMLAANDDAPSPKADEARAPARREPIGPGAAPPAARPQIVAAAARPALAELDGASQPRAGGAAIGRAADEPAVDPRTVARRDLEQALRRADLRDCKATGHVQLRVAVAADGRIGAARVDSGLDAASPAAACVAGAVSKLRLPARGAALEGVTATIDLR